MTADERPNNPWHESGAEKITHTMSGRQRWRQVGWHGQSGDLYALNEEPVLGADEKGSYRPLWALVDEDRAEDYIADEDR